MSKRAETTNAVDLWRNFTPFDTQRRFLESDAKYRLLSSGYGGGKMLRLDEPIPTPTGWTTMGELRPGDRVLDHAGQPTTVTAIYDIETPDEAWTLTFNDGAQITACADHQWWTWDYAARKAYGRATTTRPTRFDADWPAWRSSRNHRPQVRTTAEIAESLTFQPAANYRHVPNHSIPTTLPLDLPDADLPIDPYLLGYWLGDGTSASGAFTCHPDDQPNLTAAIHAAGYEPTKRAGDQTVGTRGLQVALRALGVLSNKHVPAAYLRAGADQRLELLRGLMDSDGYVGELGEKACVEFCATNRRLATGVFELAVSLGQKPRIAEGPAKLNGTIVGTKYRVTWRATTQVFRLPRKAARLNPDSAQAIRARQRFIVAAEPAEPTPMRCITVDSPHHTYLASRWMIPTHNTALGCRESLWHSVNYPGSINLIARDTGTQLRDTTMKTFWREAKIVGFQQNTHYEYNRQDKIVTWWNDSETWFRHFDDVEALGSTEFNTAFIDEGSEVSDDIYAALFPGRLRAHLPTCTLDNEIRLALAAGTPVEDLRCDCPQRAWICTNPGASGYLKQVTQGQQGDEWEWFPVRPGENPYNGPDYYAEMRRKKTIYGDVWFKRFHDGDWSAFEGQRFTMFDRARHILPTPFHPDRRYDIVEGWDFGHRETFVVWIAADPTGEEPLVVFAELKVNEVQSPQQVADAVKRIRDHYGIANRVRALGDPAGIAANQYSAISPITAYAQLGIYIAPCKIGKNPQARADLIAKWLTTERRQTDRSIWPGLVFGPDCPHVIDSLTSLRWKPGTSRLGEDPRETFIKINDHGADALGYGILGIPPPDTNTPEPAPNPNDPMAALTQPRNDTEWIDAA